MNNKKILSFIFSALLLTSTLATTNSYVKAANSKNITVANTSNANITIGTVTALSLNVRSKASITSTVLTSLKNNAKVEILSTVNDWYKIKINDSYGYISKKYVKIHTNTPNSVNPLSITNGTTKTSNSKPQIGIVTASSLNVRSDTSVTSKVLYVLKSNSKVEIVETIVNWHKIKINNSYGYVSKKFIKLK